jgi:hypothetical protein
MIGIQLSCNQIELFYMFNTFFTTIVIQLSWNQLEL